MISYLSRFNSLKKVSHSPPQRLLKRFTFFILLGQCLLACSLSDTSYLSSNSTSSTAGSAGTGAIDGGTSGSAGLPTDSGTQPTQPIKQEVTSSQIICDAEDSPRDQINISNSRDGYFLYFSSDDSNAVFEPTSSNPIYEVATADAPHGGFAVHSQASNVKADTQGNYYAGFGFTFKSGTDPTQPQSIPLYDASGNDYVGIQLYIKLGENHPDNGLVATVPLPIQIQLTEKRSNAQGNHLSWSIASSDLKKEWTQFTLLFKDLQESKFGEPLGSIDLAQITALQFIIGKRESQEVTGYDLWLDQIQFVKESNL